MIIKGIITIVFGVIKAVFSILPSLPSLPNNIMITINNVIEVIFGNTSLLPIFMRIATIKDIVNLLIVVIVFKESYGIIRWIIKKIPLSVD